ncbi:DNA cytosine methyltransferase [Rhizobium leguminosarum]|uniref:DNA cytosine methyltransferase n=1 Tax=Rhizobium leguminosarum TaxID=384 RepID=UPI003F963DF1
MAESYTKTLPEPRPIYVVDFFSGCGGVSYGFKTTRSTSHAFEVLAGIDINPDSLATYSENVGAASVLQDVFAIAEQPQLLSDLVPALKTLTPNDPLVFIGCAPCQGFSAHRKKDPRDDRRNNLMLAFARICAHFLPDFVVMENVPEILRGRFSQYYNHAKTEFENAGYSVTDGILDLSLFGVPQKRKRAVVLATRRNKLELPKAPLSAKQVRTVRDAISHLRPLEAGGVDPYDAYHRAPKHVDRILEKIKKIPRDGGDRRHLPKDEQLACHADLDEGEAPGFTDVYGRLRWDTPSVTITAKSSTPSCGRFLHPEQNRNITPREAAILQGFPHSYAFKGAFISQYRQIGEAVPPLFSRFLAKAVLDAVKPTFRFDPVFAKARSHGDKPLVVDAFSGAGGLSLGFHWAGFETALAFDVDHNAIATFNKNFGSVGRVADVRDPALRGMIRARSGIRPLVLVGGPPCQGFSQQRRGVGDDPRNNLVLEFAQLVEDLNSLPSVIILENVTYLNSPRGRDILRSFQARLDVAGYEVERFDLNSAEFGVPQLRHRIILIAKRRDLVSPLTGPISMGGGNWPTVGDVLGGLPDDGSPHEIPNHQVSAEGEKNKQRIAYVDMGGGRLSIPHDLQLDCHSSYSGHLDVYGRLDWFGQARTITGGFDSFTRGEFGHPFFNRSITHREAARLQGFPDSFEFIGNRSAVRRQIGNAVPPPLGYALALCARNLIDSTAEQPKSEFAA